MRPAPGHTRPRQRVDAEEFREPEVVADGKPKRRPVDGEGGDTVARGVVAVLPAGGEEMDLRVGCKDIPTWTEHHGGVSGTASLPRLDDGSYDCDAVLSCNLAERGSERTVQGLPGPGRDLGGPSGYELLGKTDERCSGRGGLLSHPGGRVRVAPAPGNLGKRYRGHRRDRSPLVLQERMSMAAPRTMRAARVTMM